PIEGINVWQSDFVSGGNALFTQERISFTFDEVSGIITCCEGTNLMGQVVQFANISSLEALEMFIPSDYYTFLHARMAYNPTEIIQAFTAEAFLKHPCKCYDVTNYTTEQIQSSLALQEAWPVPTPPLPKFAGKTYMAYAQFGVTPTYCSYSFDATGTIFC
ncbi:MAG: hypothetical protein EBY20_05930, partial [Alphaproteobacteria bacterium]|nr:hypothetical protein [Alphaproteobacteria bacterium]